MCLYGLLENHSLPDAAAWIDNCVFTKFQTKIFSLYVLDLLLLLSVVKDQYGGWGAP